jgi:hypothetical protein
MDFPDDIHTLGGIPHFRLSVHCEETQVQDHHIERCCTMVASTLQYISNINLNKVCIKVEASPNGCALSSTARTLGSWVRILLEGWICVSVFFCVVLSSVGRGLASG